MGIEVPTEIQKKVIPFLMQGGGDLIAQAQTGTGKTAAFGLPLLSRIDPEAKEIQGLVIATTRELAKQISKQLFRYTKYTSKIFTEVVCGGDDIERQVASLRRPTHIVVATPGRLMDLLKRKAISLDSVKHLVLDEADEMLSMGFKKELESIFLQTKKRETTWLFSATMQKGVRQMIEGNISASAHMVRIDEAHTVNRNIEHYFSYCQRDKKLEFINDFLRQRGAERGLIFCRTKAGAVTLCKELSEKGISIDVLQGDLTQKERDKVMRAFKKERVQFLIATDVAARGIDIPGLSFVVHHQLPDELKYYTHRSGRTARAGKKGISIALIEQKEKQRLGKFASELEISFKPLF